MAETQSSPSNPYRSSAGNPGSGTASGRTLAPRTRTRPGPLLIGLLVVVLLVLHQDYWFWRNGTLVFGWIPLGLFYHACLSVLASLLWLLATKIAWPLETIREAQLARRDEEIER